MKRSRQTRAKAARIAMVDSLEVRQMLSAGDTAGLTDGTPRNPVIRWQREQRGQPRVRCN